MSVTLDATGSEVHSGATTTTSISYGGLTIGAGLSNSLAVFSVVAGNSGTSTNPTFTSPTWNSVACTLATSISPSFGGITVAEFYITNPASGHHTFSATVNFGVEWFCYGVSYQNVDQTTPIPHTIGTTSAGTTSLPLNVTTQVGNYTQVIGQFGTGSTASTMQLGGVVTQDWFDNADPAAQGLNAAAGKASSSGASAAWTGHNSASDNVQMVGVDILATAAAPNVPYQPYFQQMLVA